MQTIADIMEGVKPKKVPAPFIPTREMMESADEITQSHYPAWGECQCNGLGVVAVETSPNHFQAIPCPSCAAGKIRTRKMGGLTEEQREYTIDNFKTTEENQKAVQYARRAIRKQSGIYCFYGAWGRGKTHLMCAICNAMPVQEKQVALLPMQTILDMLKASFNNSPDGNFEHTWEHIKTVDCLAIDEFEKYQSTEWSDSKMQQLIGYRYDNRERLLTLVATNSNPHKLGGYLGSRLNDRSNAIAEVRGPDYRQTEAML